MGIAFFRRLVVISASVPHLFAVFLPQGRDTVTYPLDRDSILGVIDRCAWLIAYYERAGGTPESLKAFRETMNKAINDLAALTLSTQSEVSCDSAQE
jgi:hypothetical protein